VTRVRGPRACHARPTLLSSLSSTPPTLPLRSSGVVRCTGTWIVQGELGVTLYVMQKYVCRPSEQCKQVA